MKILIATSRFSDLAGSEITVLEYAQELKEQGHEVTIASFKYAERYKQICDRHNIHVSVIHDDELRVVDWDIVWVFHAVTYYALFLKYHFKSKRVVFSSLSHYEPLESPPIESKYIDIFTTHSKENLSYFKKNFPDYRDKVITLVNSIPSQYFNRTPVLTKGKKIIIVSNHVPDEVNEARLNLLSYGWVVDIYGIGYRYEQITPDILSQYQACITIGKTVAYCLALHIPVFCYDRFGGPGWITPQNFERAEEFNFSGRCTEKKIDVRAIISSFEINKIPNQNQCIELNRIAKKRYCLSENLHTVLKLLSLSVSCKSKSNSTAEKVLLKTLELYLRDNNVQTELKDAWQTETKKREELEDELYKVKSIKVGAAKRLLSMKLNILRNKINVFCNRDKK